MNSKRQAVALGAALVLGAGLLSLACQSQPASPAAPPASASGASAAAAQPSGGQAPVAGETIRIREIANAFFPTAITVKGGSTVRLRIENQDGVNHNLVAVGDIGLKTTEQDPDMTMEVDWAVPAQPGTYKVICVYHPGMEMQLTIQ